MREGTVVLNVIHGNEIEVEYQKNQIIDKINSFFGYNCISNLKLKIVQNKIINKNTSYQKIKNLNEIEKKMRKVTNEQLKSSLCNLVKVFNERKK